MKLFQHTKNANSKKPIERKNRLVLKASASIKKSSLKDEIEFIQKTSRIKICLYRGCGGIGDILMLTPTLRAIKEEYPNYHLTFAIDTRSAGDTYFNLVKNNPYIDEIVSAHEIVRDDYHLFKDMSSVCLQYENSGAPWINRIDIFANACGFKLKNSLPYYKVEEEEKLWATSFISKHSFGKKKVMLHTASFDVKRTWPIKKYIELISILNKTRNDIVYFVNDFQGLNPYWNQYKNVINISQYKIRELAAITEQMDCFVGPDSGPMHIAGTLNVPGIVLFGSIPPQSRINHYPSLQSITTTGLSCLGCGYKACPFNIKCMTSLNAEKVAGKINEIL